MTDISKWIEEEIQSNKKIVGDLYSETTTFKALKALALAVEALEGTCSKALCVISAAHNCPTCSALTEIRRTLEGK